MLSVRSEVIEFGSLPTAPWMSQLGTLEQLQARMRQLLDLSHQADDMQGALPRRPGMCAATGTQTSR